MNIKVVNQVIILSIMMLVGVFARKKDIITKESVKSLSNFLLDITLPALLLTSFNYNYSEKMVKNAESIFLCSAVIQIIFILLSKFFVLHNKDRVKSVLRFSSIFPNSGFMGYPVLEGIFGKIGIFYGAIFNIPYNLLMFSVGVVLYTGKNNMKTVKNALLNPAVISTVIGFLMFVFSIKLPYTLYTAVSTVGSMTTPLSMIIVGSMLSEARLKDIFSELMVYYGCFLRLIVMPLLTVFILRIFHVDTLMIQICAVIEAMPAAVVASIFAEKYNADYKLAARIIFMSTIISMFTIPLITMILKYII
ncbi:MAG TPA: AEC family transporter [Clostridium sp.]|nr:AEC family transporter [Clostridiales bacterium]HBC97947.1 AEC family transporter [Clostridium sp.]